MPISSSEADGFNIICAPIKVSLSLTGSGAQRSSQISMPKVYSLKLSWAKIKLLPKGISSPLSVMKAFSGGQLLNAKTSPFGRALTEYQCIRYALDKPGVLTVLPGVRNCGDLKRILGFVDAAPEEKDYSVLASVAPQETEGVCVYCNHCQPCPAGLDVGLINKYYDLALAGDVLAGDHYANLEKKAGDCVGCGHCDARCPFHVRQTERMEKIRAYFGE